MRLDCRGACAPTNDGMGMKTNFILKYLTYRFQMVAAFKRAFEICLVRSVYSCFTAVTSMTAIRRQFYCKRLFRGTYFLYAIGNFRIFI
jgi:hypothetical protein